MPVRVLLVEDVVALRDEIAAALDPDRIEVVGQSGGVSSTLALLDAGLAFDVALVDLKLEDGSGFDVLRAIASARPEATPIALTVFDDRETVRRAILAGAQGYLLKDASAEALSAAVVEATRGGAPLTPAVARWILDAYRARQGAPNDAARPLSFELTPREIDVVRLLCDGCSYGNVAQMLGLSLGTVQGYVKIIYGKLRVTSKLELSQLARERGIV